jgi:hypothetical protein
VLRQQWSLAKETLPQIWQPENRKPDDVECDQYELSNTTFLASIIAISRRAGLHDNRIVGVRVPQNCRDCGKRIKVFFSYLNVPRVPTLIQSSTCI